MSWYKGFTLLESLDTLKNRESAENKPLIFPVQDIYKIDNKRIVVGRIEAGVIKEGDNIKILPNNNITRVNSIERYLEQGINVAFAGQSIGITTKEPVFIDRGNVICFSDKEPILTDEFCANIFWMAKTDFDISQRITIRCATQEATCKLEAIKKRIDSSTLAVIQEGGKVLKNLEVAEVIIRTKRPIAIKTFGDVQELGRFVLVRDENVCAGGIITYINKI
jgi:sulfate adenylyltransferase subunit 1 (EFTu-like GTPase family)